MFDLLNPFKTYIITAIVLAATSYIYLLEKRTKSKDLIISNLDANLTLCYEEKKSENFTEKWGATEPTYQEYNYEVFNDTNNSDFDSIQFFWMPLDSKRKD